MENIQNTRLSLKKKKNKTSGARMALLVEHETLDLGVVGSRPTVGAELT